MSILGQKNTRKTLYNNAKEAIKILLQTNPTVFEKGHTEFLGLEALINKTNAPVIGDKVSVITKLLKSEPAIADYMDYLSKSSQVMVADKSTSQASISIESIRNDWKESNYDKMALNLMVAMDPKRVLQGYARQTPVIDNMFISGGGSGSLFGLESLAAGNESFEQPYHLDFIAASSLINAQTSVPGGFMETWFSSVAIPPAQQGFDFEVQMAKILVTSQRLSNDGTNTATYGNALNLQKINLVQAGETPLILNSNSIEVVPVAIDATNPPQLVPNATVPSWSVSIMGVPYNTRPIVFGKKVGLIELSNNPTIANGGPLNLTDMLYTNISIKDIYFRLNITYTPAGANAPVTKSAIYKNYVGNDVGCVLQQKTLGRPQALQTVTTTPLNISSQSSTVSGETAATMNGIITNILGAQAGTAFNLRGSFRLSAEADVEIGSISADANEPTLSDGWYPTADGTPSVLFSISPLNNGLTGASQVTTTIDMVGYYPDARKTNSNLRINGTIIDPGNIVNYRLPINLYPPFTARVPINQMDQVTHETLMSVIELWVNGQAVDKLLSLEQQLNLITGIPIGLGTITNQSPLMSGEYVRPAYRTTNLNLPAIVNNFQSKNVLSDIRAAIQTAIMFNSMKLYMQCGYNLALQFLNNDLDAYETILVTDPYISQLLMEAGDIRTFGDQRKYVMTKSNNLAFRNKIYYSFRLVGGTDLVHPMNFGCTLVSPPVTYEVSPMAREGAITRETQVMPRMTPHVLLPVLGVINVTCFDAYAQTQ